MITINFYKDGAYITGHDIPEICTLVSYAMWTCINDCIEENPDVAYYESANDQDWNRLGLTYIKINLDVPEHVKIFNRFETNITCWISEIFPNRVKVINHQNNIVWEEALLTAKKEQKII